VTARVDSNTVGPQYDLHKFDAIRKKRRGKNLSCRTCTNQHRRRFKMA